MSAFEEWLRDLLIAHNIDMLRAEASIRASVIALLATMQQNIVSLLASKPEMSLLGKQAKNTLIRESNAIISDYYGRAQLEVDLQAVAEVEAAAVRDALVKIVDFRPTAELPTQAELKAAVAEARATVAESKAMTSAAAEIRIGVQAPSENYLRTLVSDTLVQGSPAKNWWLRQEQDTQFKIANEIRIGAAQGETNAQIISRIVGQEVTAKAPDAPGGGVIPLARRNAAAIVQTSMAAIAAQARRATFQANRDIARGIEQISTLDSHTSLQCVAYSGATWDLDYKPIDGNQLPYDGGVPRHFNCRSAEIMLMKTLREMGIDMDEPDAGTRASSSGQISAKTTFADYLKMKGADYQNEVLGPGRAELFRQGKLTPQDLVSSVTGRPLRLSDLRAKYGG